MKRKHRIFILKASNQTRNALSASPIGHETPTEEQKARFPRTPHTDPAARPPSPSLLLNSLLLPLPITRIGLPQRQIAPQRIERDRPWRHRTLHAARGAGRAGERSHLPFLLPVAHEGLGGHVLGVASVGLDGGFEGGGAGVGAGAACAGWEEGVDGEGDVRGEEGAVEEGGLERVSGVGVVREGGLGRCTYHMRIATAKAPLACWQNPRTAPVLATAQLRVMYQGAPGWGNRGSLMSEPDWPWTLTA